MQINGSRIYVNESDGVLSVTEHEYMQINGSRIYVNESDGVIGPMFLRCHGFMGFVVS